MRRVLALLALLILAVPASWASGRVHSSAVAVHARALSTAATIHTHAPGIFPKADHAGGPNGSDTKSPRESTLAGFVVRTMLGFSGRFSH